MVGCLPMLLINMFFLTKKKKRKKSKVESARVGVRANFSIKASVTVKTERSKQQFPSQFPVPPTCDLSSSIG